MGLLAVEAILPGQGKCCFPAASFYIIELEQSLSVLRQADFLYLPIFSLANL